MFWDNLFKKNKNQESPGEQKNTLKKARQELQDNINGNTAAEDPESNKVNITNNESLITNQNNPQINDISNLDFPDDNPLDNFDSDEVFRGDNINEEFAAEFDFIPDAEDVNAKKDITEDTPENLSGEPDVTQNDEPLSEPETLSDSEILHDTDIPTEPEISPKDPVADKSENTQDIPPEVEEEPTDNIYHDNVDENIFEDTDPAQVNASDTDTLYDNELLKATDDDISAYEKVDFSDFSEDFGENSGFDETDLSAFNEADGFENNAVSKEAFDEFNSLFDQLVSENTGNDDLLDRLKSSDDVDSLDKMIEAALEADRRFSETNEFDEQLQEFVSDIAVYDTEEREEVMELLQNEAEKAANDLEKDKIKERKMRIIALGTGVLIIILGVAAYFLAKQIETVNQPVIKQTNTAGFIYISREAMLKDEKIVLKKMLLDNVSTVFYFSKDIGIDSKVITLTDNKNTQYHLDLSYMLLKLDEAEESTPTVLRFDPLNNDITEFSLKIKDIESNEAVEFRFGAEEHLEKNISRHLSQPLKVMDDTEGLTVNITSADFSTSGSKIGFTMNWNEDSPSLYLGKSSYKDPIVLQDRRGLVTKALPEPLQVQFDNMIVGRVDFGPVKSVEEKVDLYFDNLYKRFELNDLFPLAPIVNNIEGNERVIQLGNYKFVLERLIRQQDNYILVMHSEEGTGDSGLPGGRVETVIEAKLAAVSPEGTVSFLDGTVHSGAQGTDMVFDASQADEIFRKAPLNSIMLKLDTVLIKMPTVSTTIDLSKLKTQKEPGSNLVLLENIFKQRHEYKAGKIPFSKITGFTDEVLNDPLLKSKYTPLRKVNNVDYSVQILTHNVKDGLLYGLMGETFKGDSLKTQMSLLHKIIAKPQGNGFLVIYDEIIG